MPFTPASIQRQLQCNAATPGSDSSCPSISNGCLSGPETLLPGLAPWQALSGESLFVRSGCSFL